LPNGQPFYRIKCLLPVVLKLQASLPKIIVNLERL
jgi:hypothetical protein